MEYYYKAHYTAWRKGFEVKFKIMDIETYNSVLTKRGEDPHEFPNDARVSGHDKLTRADIAFRKDLIRDKVVWYNEQKSDWHAYIKNYHPLYSICNAPKEHPFSRGERLVVFIADIGFASFLSICTSIILKEAQGISNTYYSQNISS